MVTQRIPPAAGACPCLSCIEAGAPSIEADMSDCCWAADHERTLLQRAADQGAAGLQRELRHPTNVWRPWILLDHCLR